MECLSLGIKRKSLQLLLSIESKRNLLFEDDLFRADWTDNIYYLSVCLISVIFSNLVGISHINVKYLSFPSTVIFERS